MAGWRGREPLLLGSTELHKSLCLKDQNHTNQCTHMHAIAVIGYSGSDLYYVDTCSNHDWPNQPTSSTPATHIACRGNAVGDAAAKGESGYANVWKISATLLWRLMRQQTTAGGGHLGGYYYFGSNEYLYMRHMAW
jgi:hypothetical protein